MGHSLSNQALRAWGGSDLGPTCALLRHSCFPVCTVWGRGQTPHQRILSQVSESCTRFWAWGLSAQGQVSTPVMKGE